MKRRIVDLTKKDLLTFIEETCWDEEDARDYEIKHIKIEEITYTP